MRLLRWLMATAALTPLSLTAQVGNTAAFPLGERSHTGASASKTQAAPTELPASPGSLGQAAATPPRQPNPQHRPPPCLVAGRSVALAPEAVSATQARRRCPDNRNPFLPFLDLTVPLVRLTPAQKGYLALHDVVDPFNLLTIVGNSAFSVAIDAHSAYGPGMRGFGKNVGVSLLQDATGEVIGTWAVCSLLRQDPHYYRMPQASILRRVGHALAHAVVAQGDNGHTIPNYENLITYPASAEISNLYVPGVNGNGPSTVARIMTGLATEPIGNLVAEFLPDFARRIHVRVLIVQQIINQVARGDQM